MQNWVGIGFTNLQFKLDRGSNLGMQSTEDCSVFCQGSTRIEGRGKVDSNFSEMLQSGDIIKVDVDFDRKIVHFFRNGAQIGTVLPNSLPEGKLYPCVNISSQGVASFYFGK